MAARPALILFARRPLPGQVKTRLVPRLGAEGAAALYRAFLEDAGRVYLRPVLWTSVLCADPDPAGSLFDPWFPEPWERTAQAPGDLGLRLCAAFEEAFHAGAPYAVAVGSDHPTLPLESLVDAFSLLASGVGSVLLPAQDGGYCAIGLAAGAPLPKIFGGVPWSTDAVLAETVARLERAGVRHRLLSPAYDVDRPEDLDRLRRDLDERDPDAGDFPRATAAAMKALAQAPS